MWENKDAFIEDVKDTDWWWGKARMEIVYECLKDIATHNMDILEIGAGYGHMTTMLSRFGVVKAIEPYPDAVSYLQNKLGIDTYQNTLESFTVEDKHDLIACFDVLEHIADDKTALLKMESLINDKGILILTVPAYGFLWNKHDRMNLHYRRYTKEELIKIIPHGLIVKRVSYFNTFLFPVAVFDKLIVSKNKKSYAFNPSKLINALLYRIFVSEKILLRYCNLPFGVSILLIAEKRVK
jgi:2-polyprenyl-3-methyl-5-hydroxy-6-metoxy-1,4-benzoquinol methylase